MGDVLNALEMIASIGLNGVETLSSLSTKQEVLTVLLNDEQMRLQVWLTPLDHESRRRFALGHSSTVANVVCPRNSIDHPVRQRLQLPRHTWVI